MKRFFKKLGYGIFYVFMVIILFIWQLPQNIVGLLYLLFEKVITPIQTTIYRIQHYNVGINAFNHFYHTETVANPKFKFKMALNKHVVRYFRTKLAKPHWIMQFIPKFIFIKYYPLEKYGFETTLGMFSISRLFVRATTAINDKQLQNVQSYYGVNDYIYIDGYRMISVILGPLYLFIVGIPKMIRDFYYCRVLINKYEYKATNRKKLIKRYRSHWDAKWAYKLMT